MTEIHLSIAIILVFLAAAVAWDIKRAKRKKAAPSMDIGFEPSRIGYHKHKPDWPYLSDIVHVCRVEDQITAFIGHRMEPVVLVMRQDPIPLPTGGIAAGVYHSTRKGWDHAWIELYSWAALAHELLHHASGLEDTKEFRELYKRFQMRTK